MFLFFLDFIPLAVRAAALSVATHSLHTRRNGLRLPEGCEPALVVFSQHFWHIKSSHWSKTLDAGVVGAGAGVHALGPGVAGAVPALGV